MGFNLKFIQMESWNNSSKGFWIRFFGYGIHVTNSRLNFSERNNFVKFYKLPFGYRLIFFNSDDKGKR